VNAVPILRCVPFEPSTIGEHFLRCERCKYTFSVHRDETLDLSAEILCGSCRREEEKGKR
jgi:uncharacterized C2H2 Zn-finger protein